MIGIEFCDKCGSIVSEPLDLSSCFADAESCTLWPSSIATDFCVIEEYRAGLTRPLEEFVAELELEQKV